MVDSNQTAQDIAKTGNINERILKELHRLNVGIGLQYRQTQLLEATKTPGAARIWTFNGNCPNLPVPRAVQLVPKTSARKTVAVLNSGTQAVYWAFKSFDPNILIAALAAGGGVVEGGLLAAGQTMNCDTASAVWIYVFNATPANCQVQALESIFSEDQSAVWQPQKTPGSDGLAINNQVAPAFSKVEQKHAQAATAHGVAPPNQSGLENFKGLT
jgi:hypothetical protein